MPARFRRLTGVVAIGAVLAAIGVVAWVFVLVLDEPSPIVPTPVGSPVALVPATSPPAKATPLPTVSVVPTVVPGSLPDLLRYAPDRLADNSLPLSDIARYANISGWMSARGVATPVDGAASASGRWQRELDLLAIPDVIHARGNEAIWRETYGFGLADVDALLAVGSAPDLVIVMRGDFEASTLEAAWVQSGYQAIRAQGHTIWSLFPGDAVDLSAPASRPALGNMNNVILLDDGTLIATSRLSRMEEALAVVRGEAPSLAGNPAISALLAPGAGAGELATALIVKGSVLAMAQELVTPIATRVPEVPGTPGATPAMAPPMPEAGLVLAGLSPPPAPDAAPIFSLVVSYDSAGDATLAMRRANRALREDESPLTGRPYANRLRPVDLRVVGANGAGSVVLVRARPLAGAGDWMAVLDQRDLGFLAWPWDEDR